MVKFLSQQCLIVDFVDSVDQQSCSKALTDTDGFTHKKHCMHCRLVSRVRGREKHRQEVRLPAEASALPTLSKILFCQSLVSAENT